MPARNIVVVCSGSHEKKVNLGEVFRRLLEWCTGGALDRSGAAGDAHEYKSQHSDDRFHSLLLRYGPVRRLSVEHRG
jgi:hypothetical protein